MTLHWCADPANMKIFFVLVRPIRDRSEHSSFSHIPTGRFDQAGRGAVLSGNAYVEDIPIMPVVLQGAEKECPLNDCGHVR